MKILKVSSSKKIIEKIAEAIEKGKVIVLPTDTVYGLICDAQNEEAVEKLLKIKKRKNKKPIPIFVKGIEMAKKLAFINKSQEKILRKLWPGKVTFVLKRKKSKLPKILFGNKKTIGLRIPNYKVLGGLLKKINLPLAETSANISGKSASIRIKEILEQFKNQRYQPDLIFDAGNLKKNKPSAVIDLTASKTKIIREGPFSKKELKI